MFHFNGHASVFHPGTPDPVAANLVWVGEAFYQARGHLEQAVSAECVLVGEG